MFNKQKIELAATTYADKKCSAWANDYDGFIAGVQWYKEQISTFPKMSSKGLINLLEALCVSESVFIKYSDYSKNTINNAIYNAAVKLKTNSLILHSKSQKDGKMIWVSAYCG